MNEDGGTQLNGVPEPLNSSFEISLKMISDWHVGSGGGRPGNVDSLVRRDADGFPYVPAKTLTGIWRDACERVALGLDQGHEDGLWNRWVDYLFGDQPAIRDAEFRVGAGQSDSPEEPSTKRAADMWHRPRRAALSVRSAHLPADLRQALRSKPVAREAVTFVKPGISIHPLTGSARTDYLRFEEMARAGVSLAATCEFRGLQEEHRHLASALLIAGAKLVERLGGKRRRGAGRCQLTIVGFAEIEPWVAWLASNRRPVEPPRRERPEPARTDDHVVAALGAWLRLGLRLTTKLPVIVPSGTIGNLIRTLDYIPGTYLLPHLTKRLAEIDAQAAIARGDVVVTNATIEIEGAKGRPVPFSLAHPKSGGGLKDGKDVFNLLCDERLETQPKNHRDGYVGSTVNRNSLPFFEKVNPVVETHNVVKDDVQRPTEEIGGVYSYQAIPSGVTLQGELRVRQSLGEALAREDPKWFNKLEGELRLGRASKDDYGAVELKVISQPEPIVREGISGELTVWLLSDLLLRDERLRPTASIESLRSALQDQLNAGLEEPRKIKLKLPMDSANGPRTDRAFSRQRRTDSWHVGWGLPRPSLAGLQAGTCAVFEVEGEIDGARRAEIEAGGIGERRAEGYGQVCFNDSLVTSRLGILHRAAAIKNEQTEPIFLVSRKNTFDYARLIEHQAARNEIHRSAPGFAADPDNRKRALGIEIIGERSKPRMSQLGALRSVISRLRSAADGRSVIDWTSRLAASPNRRSEWPNERLAHVDELVNNNDRVWQLLEIDFSKLVLTEDGAEELKRELWPEAMRALVDACVRAHKRDLEGD